MKLFHSSGLECGGIPKLPRPEIPAAPEELHLSFHRHFDPSIGQWLSDDPIAFAAHDQNLRPYVGGRPQNPSTG